MRQYSLFLIIIIGRLIMLNKGVDCLQYVFYSIFEYDEIDCIITFLSKKSPSAETFTESMIISSPKFFSENFPRFHFFNYSFFGAFFGLASNLYPCTEWKKTATNQLNDESTY